ncbi:hypothetical protein GCM10025778_08670 [Paeniglutamicibacter antarcticus]|uniref:Uncharacterized protein n=1 Tax=Paeniglutamicibacter antarcticus TaxID=494023 RepID=A0ABP9TJL2_9MICC
MGVLRGNRRYTLGQSGTVRRQTARSASGVNRLLVAVANPLGKVLHMLLQHLDAVCHGGFPVETDVGLGLGGPHVD